MGSNQYNTIQRDIRRPEFSEIAPFWNDLMAILKKWGGGVREVYRIPQKRRMVEDNKTPTFYKGRNKENLFYGSRDGFASGDWRSNCRQVR